MAEIDFPALSMAEIQPSLATLQIYAQVLGKIRRALTPRQKHWGHVSLRATATGLTTTPIPAGKITIGLLLDLTSHQIKISTSQGERWNKRLRGQSAATFFDETLGVLNSMDVFPEIDRSLFSSTAEGLYDPLMVERYWQVLSQIDAIFKRFKGELREETSPVRLCPHHLDLAMLWFSGQRVPGADPDDEDSADEQMNFGFSPGDEGIANPYFYITAYPMPDRLVDTQLPDDAHWHTKSFTGVVLPYNSLEHKRLAAHREGKVNWKKWGPYLSERAWGTVREDYSPYGSAWEYFPHDHARSRAYRWNEDGLAGISDRHQYLCFAPALWNGKDTILKERMFGLTGTLGNHGEDAKEYWFYLDSTPTHSYMKMLYKYPQRAFPYSELEQENGRRGFFDFEHELLDTGVFAENRYFDVFVEYAKAAEDDILIQITAVNRGPEAAEIHLLPSLWCRNTWSWGYPNGPMEDMPGKPVLTQSGDGVVQVKHPAAGDYWLYAESAETLLFTENETNNVRLYGIPDSTPYVKDGFHRAIIDNEVDALNQDRFGTKVAAYYRHLLGPGESWSVRLRLVNRQADRPFIDFDDIFKQRIVEADEFYDTVQRQDLSDDERRVQRQAFAGLLWTKQLFYYDVKQWLNGDPSGPPPPESRKNGRNRDWEHLNNFDVISMPDKWEYPWYAAWDLAFHCIPLVMVDPDFAKRQLVLMTREWYMHPSGQLPAYEWAFGDVNPPVHAWATWRVYKIDAKQTGRPDRAFLEGVFHKLLLNFTWWVNKKDEDGRNVFQGGFLGLDNISLFDRSSALPTGGHLDQADGTAWMAFYTLGMLKIALELAKENPIYQDLATKFFEHFLAIASAISAGFDGHGLWDDEDGFYYDVLHLPDDTVTPLKVRSLVGLMPLLAVETLEPDLLAQMSEFDRRIHWMMKFRPNLTGNLASVDEVGVGERHLLSIVTKDRLSSVLRYMLDENEFLSPYGIRSVSKMHETPYSVSFGGDTFSINYQPAESQSGLFGGNSNWRGPIWFPINYILIESLQKFHHYYGDSFQVECPTGSGNWMTLGDVATELSRRLTRIFLRNEHGERPVYGGTRIFQDDPHWRDQVLFFEYFHGDNGAGLGASHQTGWTGLVAKLIQQSGGY